MTERRAAATGAEPVDAVSWLGFAFICGAALLAALFELMLVPLYAGKVPVPLCVVLAIVSNFLLPTWGARTVERGIGAVVPVLLWLIGVLALSMITRPEGDLFVTSQQQWMYYALILLGAVAGFTAIVRATAQPAARTPPPRPAPTNQTARTSTRPRPGARKTNR